MSQLHFLRRHLEEEVKQQQKMLEDLRRSKGPLLEALQQQRQDMEELKRQHELLKRTHTCPLRERRKLRRRGQRDRQSFSSYAAKDGA